MGAIAIGTGAVVGALVPETPQERQVLGDASQKLGTAVRDVVVSGGRRLRACR